MKLQQRTKNVMTFWLVGSIARHRDGSPMNTEYTFNESQSEVLGDKHDLVLLYLLRIPHKLTGIELCFPH